MYIVKKSSGGILRFFFWGDSLKIAIPGGILHFAQWILEFFNWGILKNRT